MQDNKKELSVTEAARICGVGRTTVGYWVRTNKIRGNRKGRNYKIPIEDLVLYLRAIGQEVPAELLEIFDEQPVFKSFQNCWEFWSETKHGKKCPDCAVFKNKINDCFTTGKEGCPDCRYFQEHILPKISFVHQHNQPAAIVKNLSFWIGNSAFAKLCGLKTNDLIGIGFEKVFHPDSLAFVMTDFKKREYDNPNVNNSYKVFLNNKTETQISIHSLNEPDGTFLILVN